MLLFCSLTPPFSSSSSSFSSSSFKPPPRRVLELVALVLSLLFMMSMSRLERERESPFLLSLLLFCASSQSQKVSEKVGIYMLLFKDSTIVRWGFARVVSGLILLACGGVLSFFSRLCLVRFSPNISYVYQQYTVRDTLNMLRGKGYRDQQQKTPRRRRAYSYAIHLTLFYRTKV